MQKSAEQLMDEAVAHADQIRRLYRLDFDVRYHRFAKCEKCGAYASLIMVGSRHVTFAPHAPCLGFFVRTGYAGMPKK